MKDYSKLKGLPVKRANHPNGLEYKDCYVAEIDDCGLTILGYCTNSLTYSQDEQVKVFCLRNEIDHHLEKFPVVVEMILNGIIDIDTNEIFGSGEPPCAFE